MDLTQFFAVSVIFTLCWTNCESENGQRFGESGPSLEVEIVQGFPEAKEFFNDFALQSRPLKMAGAAKLSPAFKTWEDSYFLAHQEASEAFVNVETRKKENRTQQTLDITFSEFVQSYNDTDNYMVDPVPDFLKNEVILPGPLQCPDVAENNLVENIMWFSSGGTKSVVHTDAVDNILCLFRGEKVFVMVDPEKYVDRVKMDHPEGAYSDVDVDNVDYDAYPGLIGIEFYHVNISAGDCLYVPYRWIHQVRSYNRNIAVNIWWDHHKNSQIDLEKCPKKVNVDFTLDQVDFASFSETMNSISSLRDQFYDFSQQTKGLSFQKVVHFFAGHLGIEDIHVGEGYKVPLKKIFQILDANRDGEIHEDEVSATPDEDWEIIQENMQRFDAIIGDIERRLNGQPAEEEEEENARDEL